MYWKMRVDSVHQGDDKKWVIGRWYYTGSEVREFTKGNRKLVLVFLTTIHPNNNG